MSEVAQVALIAGGIGFVTTLATLLFNLWSQAKEREERYKVGLYEKRLAVHQEAFKHVNVLNLKVPSADDSVHEDDVDNKELAGEVERVYSWLLENALYLDPISGREIVRLLKLCAGRASGDVQVDIDSQLRKTLSTISRGIGIKHLDTKDIQRALENIKIRDQDAK